MRKTVIFTRDGIQESVELATVLVETVEVIQIGGKKGIEFNIALTAASILSAGDKERGTEAWVRKLPFFGETFGEDAPFVSMLQAASAVNGMKTAVAVAATGEGLPSEAATVQ